MSPISTVLLLATICTSDGLKFASGPHRSVDGQIDLQRSADDQIEPNLSADGHLLDSYRSAEEQINRQRSEGHQIYPAPSADDLAHSQNSSNSHAIQLRLPTDVNKNDHICNPNPCDSGGFCLKCHADSGTCRSETDWHKGFVCLYPHGNHFDDVKMTKSHPIAPVHRKMAVEEKWSDRSADGHVNRHRTADIHKINLNRPNEDQINPHRPADERINRHRSAKDDKFNWHRSAEHKISLNGPADAHLISLIRSALDHKIDQYRSAPDEHICSPNPCQPGSFCLNCAVYNCTNQTTKDHLCLCQLGKMWKNCDEAEMETTKSSAKVPENICAFVNSCGKFGSCVPDSNYPGFHCKCDKNHTGTNCDWEIFAWVLSLYGVVTAAVIIVIAIVMCVVCCIAVCCKEK